MRWLWLAIVGVTVAHATPPTTAVDRFEHPAHDEVIKAAGLSCEGCHPSSKKRRGIDPAPCHDCHGSPDTTWGPTAPWQQPTGCDLCHTTIAPPADHGAGWLSAHGEHARDRIQTCDACHGGAFCVGCHERKDTTRYRVHDRTWLSVHGMDARVDPSRCGACHQQIDCVTCHQTGVGPWP